VIRICASCGGSFYADEDWKTVCLPCWKRRKRQEQAESQSPYWAPVSATESKLRSQLALANLRIAELEQRAAEVELDPKTLRWLRQVAHPDKHNGSQLATEASVFLNALRVKR